MKIRSGSFGSKRIGMQAHPASPRLPLRARRMAAEPGQLVPGFPGVAGAKQGSVFDAGVDRVRIGERRFEVPNPLEFPGMGRAVIP